MELYFNDQRTIVMAVMIGLDFILGTIAALMTRTWSFALVGQWFLSNVIRYGGGMALVFLFALTINSETLRDIVLWTGYLIAGLALIGSFVVSVQKVQNRPAPAKTEPAKVTP